MCQHMNLFIYPRPVPPAFPFTGDEAASHSFVYVSNQDIALDTLRSLPASLHPKQHLVYSIKIYSIS